MSKLTGPVAVVPASDSLSRHATALASVGSRAFSEDGEFVYVGAGGAITASGDPVSVAGELSAVLRGGTGVGAFLGSAEAPFASGEYGYIRVKGPTTGVVESGAVAGDQIELSSNVGKFKKITTSGTAVGICKATSDNAGSAAVAIHLGK